MFLNVDDHIFCVWPVYLLFTHVDPAIVDDHIFCVWPVYLLFTHIDPAIVSLLWHTCISLQELAKHDQQLMI